jgi:hypothetical protein
MKKKELLRRLARAELRTEIHYQMLRETNVEVDKLKEQLNAKPKYHYIKPTND